MCLDDFGAGAAGFQYLRRLAVDFVKIDGAFLRAAAENARDRALIASLASICRELRCATIGEMIETEKEARAAAALGIDFGQGWHFGRPGPLPEPIGRAVRPQQPPMRALKRRGAVETWQ